MLKPEYTTQFKKDYKLSAKRRLDLTLIDELINDLIEEKPLSEKNRDHALIGEYKGCRECHIQPNWLLIYRIIDKKDIIFVRTGSHSDLFSEN
jgi:mRNA interferase YafQ